MTDYLPNITLSVMVLHIYEVHVLLNTPVNYKIIEIRLSCILTNFKYFHFQFDLLNI